ncbi:MAG: anthranilate synthase component I [Chloroflexi bacterium]|nr:anthranilate synthase component I [Chloroflexota bacterium]MCI0782846.1 anthranilate synthase component I [Chloroflexota bacterium]MCI0814122.1 anthranilate synthase component I [Chloroflexota bacterium]MCI0817767.1 anthranilate synthase component I [Chloroflexota bacterium]MCI0819257.1 anthranilate synthase component I [Chloroflexota bacterium]
MNYIPPLEDVLEEAKRGESNLIPVFRDVPADLETPVSAFLKVARGEHSFLLESVEGGERLARYSFIGTEPYRVYRSGPYADPNDGADPLTEVEAEMSRYKIAHPKDVEARTSLPRFTGGAVGFLAYDVVRHFEPRVQVPADDPQGLPEALFMFVDALLVFDHIKHVIKVVAHCRLDGDVETSYRQACWRIEELAKRLNHALPASPYQTALYHPQGDVTSSVTRDRYYEMVEQAKQYIVAGDIIQVVPSQRLSRETAAHPFSIYRALRMVNPSPYMYYLAMGDAHIIGASPEMLVRVEDGVVETHPIAGTMPRGRDPDEDAAIAEKLAGDEKERAEHVMLVDLGRNDIGRVSKPGTVTVKDFMVIERYSHLMHLVSRVTGQLKDGMSAYDALRACFPAGTLSGAPKIRAMEIISEMEPIRRGPYGGAVGYFDFSGNMDTAITIRTIVHKDGVAHIQAGGGIVYDSVPDSEFRETLTKAGATLQAIDDAEAMEQSALTGSLGY